MNVEPWFPTPIYHADLKGTELDLVQAELKAMYLAQKDRMSKNPSWERDTHNLTDPNFNCNVLAEFNCVNFIEVLNRTLLDYVQTVGADPDWASDYRIMNSWCTSNRQHEYARLHDHGVCDISGVYYLETTGEDGDFYFKTPNTLLQHSYVFQKIPSEMAIKPKVGKLLMWPAYMEHGTRVNATDSERVSISFNIAIKRWYQDVLFPQDVMDIVNRTNQAKDPDAKD